MAKSTPNQKPKKPAAKQAPKKQPVKPERRLPPDLRPKSIYPAIQPFRPDDHGIGRA